MEPKEVERRDGALRASQGIAIFAGNLATAPSGARPGKEEEEVAK